jgi:PhnB protein
MANKVRAVPEGLHTITPQLVVNDGAKFIDFMKKAFGAEEITRMSHPSGKGIWHASLRVGSSMFFIADESTSNTKSARSAGGTPVTLQINVENADQMFKQATIAGATVAMPLMDMFWGDRYGQVVDPFGNTWAISTHVKDVSPQEMERGAKEAAAQQGSNR